MQIYKIGFTPKLNYNNNSGLPAKGIKSESKASNPINQSNMTPVNFTSFLTTAEIDKVKKGFCALDKRLDVSLSTLSKDFFDGKTMQVIDFKTSNAEDLSDLGLYIKDLKMEIIPEQNFFTTKITAQSHSGTKTEVTFPDGSVDKSRMAELLNPSHIAYYNFIKKLSTQFKELSEQFIMDSTELL